MEQATLITIEVQVARQAPGAQPVIDTHRKASIRLEGDRLKEAERLIAKMQELQDAPRRPRAVDKGG